MTNSPEMPIHWSRLLGLCPLVAIGFTVSDALLFGAVLCVTLALTDASVTMLRDVVQRWQATAQHLIVRALMAATIAGCVDVLLQSTYYAQSATLQLFLPLLVIVAMLFDDTHPSNDITIARALRNTAQRSALFAAALLIAAVARAWLPREAGLVASLVGSGLLLAAANKYYPQPLTDNTTVAVPRSRARVTGPVR